ncbi:MAG: hypothetical protein Q7R54_01495 [bacterium]|nr:hypothetical protein [bacterium]
MRIKTVLLAPALLLLPVHTAAAQQEPTSITLYEGVFTRYSFQDFGFHASHEPVAQGGVTIIHGKWLFDWWHSVGLSEEGAFGRRGGQDESDFTGAFSDSFDSPLGKIDWSGTVAYYISVIPGDGDLYTTRDDFIDFHVDVSRTYAVGSNVTITPFVRATEIAGIGIEPAFTLIRTGARIAYAPVSWFTLKAEVSPSWNLTDNGPDVVRSTIDAVFNLGGGWTFTGEAKFASKIQPAFGGIFSYTFGI